MGEHETGDERRWRRRQTMRKTTTTRKTPSSRNAERPSVDRRATMGAVKFRKGVWKTHVNTEVRKDRR